MKVAAQSDFTWSASSSAIRKPSLVRGRSVLGAPPPVAGDPFAALERRLTDGGIEAPVGPKQAVGIEHDSLWVVHGESIGPGPHHHRRLT